MKKRSLFVPGVAALLLFSLIGCGDTPAAPAADPTTTTLPSATTTTPPPAEPDALLTMTVVEDTPADATVYVDASVDACNYTLQFTAGEDLTNLRLMTIADSTYLFDRTLYTLPTLAKGERVYIRTYVNDATPIRGIAIVDAQGDAHYYRPTYSGKDGSITLQEQESTTATGKRVKDIQDYLNKMENNGFVGTLNLYDAPQKASFYGIFYDGAGVGEWSTDHWDAAEQAAVLSACGWDEFYVPVLKIKAADVERVLQAKLGVSYAQMEKTMEECGFGYVKEYDAYYNMHSDTNYLPVEVSTVTLTPEGLYVVEYTQPQYDADDHLVVTLRADKEAGYRFVSNVKADKA